MNATMQPWSATSDTDIRAARILCAEDDPAIRHCIESVLTKAGHSVTVTADGQEAWEALRAGSYDLLITDNNMPRLSGAKLALMARRAGMRLPIVVASSDLGFLEDPSNRWLEITPLQKPFTMARLTELAGRILPPPQHIRPWLKNAPP